MLHWSLQTSISPNLKHLAIGFGHTLICPNVTKPEIENLKKLAPAPNISIGQLRDQIANFRNINPDTDRPWIYYVGEEVQDLV